MDVTSLTLAVVGLFKDAYLTIKFVHRCLSTIRRFREGHADMALRYGIQIYRLRYFWAVFTGKMDNTINIKAIDKDPNKLLPLLRSTFLQISRCLCEYSKLAKELDEDHKKYCTDEMDNIASAAMINDFPFDLGDKAIEKKHGFWGGAKFWGTKDAGPKAEFGWKDIPKGFHWLFKKNVLEQSLEALKGWNDQLQSIPEMNGQDVIKMIGDALKRGNYEGLKIFEGRAKLRKIADPNKSSKLDREAAHLETKPVVPLEWGLAKKYIAESTERNSKTLVEWKRTGNFGSTDDLQRAEQAVEQQYAPKLAELLDISGRDYFETAPLRTLPFRGFARNPSESESHFVYIFDYPAGAGGRKPRSLYELIGGQDKSMLLNARFEVAKMLAQCLGALHNDRWLHKSIRSHAIKFFFPESLDVYDSAHPYLTDFELSRPVNTFSAGVYANRGVDLERDVYRHPERFGSQPEKDFNAVHDIYALGVVLLEIGLWKTALQMFEELRRSPKAAAALKDESSVKGADVQEYLIKRAEQELGHYMGSSYKSAVLACLRGDLYNVLGEPNFVAEYQKTVVGKLSGGSPGVVEDEDDEDWDAKTEIGD